MNPNNNPPAWALEAAKEAVPIPSPDNPWGDIWKPFRDRLAAIIAKHAPQPDCPKPSNDGAAPSKWQRITAENPPQFPCWLWSAERGRHHANNPGDYRPIDTHWHPDAPDAPTSGPEAGAPLSDLVHRGPAAQTSSATPQPGPTPETDAEWERYVRNGEHDAGQHFARRLERERDEARRERDALRNKLSSI